MALNDSPGKLSNAKPMNENEQTAQGLREAFAARTRGGFDSKPTVTIAISTVDDGRLGHLGETRQFVLVEADPQSRAVLRSHVAEAPLHEPGSFPRWLREKSARVVIVAGIGQRALDNLVYHGIEVRAGAAGALVTELVAGYFAGRLPRTLHGCDRQHSPAAPARECQLAGFLEKQSGPETKEDDR